MAVKPKRKLWASDPGVWAENYLIMETKDRVLFYACKNLFHRYVGFLKPGETRELIVRLGKRKLT